MNNDKPYYEGFFAVRFEVGGIRITAITQEQYQTLENAVAECNIPLNLEDRDYCMIAMLIDLPADQPAIGAMLMLKSVVADVVQNNPDHFKRVG